VATNIDDYGFKAVPRGLVITDNATGVIYVLPNPSKFALNTGITELKKMAASQLGVKVTSTTVIASEEPLITLSFATATAFIAGMLMGRKFALQSISSYLAKNNLLLAASTRAGVSNAGEEGYGSLADVAGAKAAVFRANQNVPLTYVANYAGFSTSGTTDSFAVGANHALKFSDNLIGSPVSYQIPLPTAQRLALTADTNFDYGVKVFFLDLANRVSLFEATSVKPVLGKTFDPSAESVDVELRVNYSGSTCAPYSFQYLTSNDVAVC
jgi:hypothetical protein